MRSRHVGRVQELRRHQLVPAQPCAFLLHAQELGNQPFAAASLVLLTMSAAVPLPASRFTTAVFIALPTFWPKSVSRNWDV